MLNHELRPLLVSNASLHQLVQQQYGVDFESAELLKDNLNFVFATPSLILRFSPAGKKDLREILAELRWTQFLNDGNLPVNRIIPATSGELYLTVNVAKEKLYLVVFERSLGGPITGEDWNVRLFSKLGTLTGQLHQASLAFRPQVDHNFPHWNEHSKCACLTALPDDERRLPQILEQLNRRLAAQPQPEDQYGVIHYDIHQGNYFILREAGESSLFLFDFEMTCLGWYLQEVAVILYYASNYNTAINKASSKSFESEFLEAFGASYCKFMPEVSLDYQLIQDHLLYRDLFVYAYVLDAWQGRELSAGDQRLLNQLEANIASRSGEKLYLRKSGEH